MRTSIADWDNSSVGLGMSSTLRANRSGPSVNTEKEAWSTSAPPPTFGLGPI